MILRNVGEGVAIGKHNYVANHVARRVAEELGDALVIPPSPYAPAGDPVKKTGHMRFPGTVSVSAETSARTNPIPPVCVPACRSRRAWPDAQRLKPPRACA